MTDTAKQAEGVYRYAHYGFYCPKCGDEPDAGPTRKLAQEQYDNHMRWHDAGRPYEPTPDEKRIVEWHRRQARWYVSKGLMLEADCHSAAASAIKCGEHREEQA